MNNKELWAIINISEVLKNTEVEKVLNCYDFAEWEINELMSLKNDTELSLNEFRWKYIRETLEITDEDLCEEGLMVRDLIEDIKMGYHKYEEYMLKGHVMKEMNFEFELYRDFETSKISIIHIYYEDTNISSEEKRKEIDELLSFLNLDKKTNILCK